MTQYIILPVTQTEGMSGYSAIAIELSLTNVSETKEILENLIKAQQISNEISSLTYDNPKLRFHLLNDEYEATEGNPYTENILETELDEYEQDGETKVSSPSLNISQQGLRITYVSKYSGDEAQVYAEIAKSDLVNLLIL